MANVQYANDKKLADKIIQEGQPTDKLDKEINLSLNSTEWGHRTKENKCT